jgi:hypothetical protein
MKASNRRKYRKTRTPKRLCCPGCGRAVKACTCEPCKCKCVLTARDDFESIIRCKCGCKCPLCAAEREAYFSRQFYRLESMLASRALRVRTAQADWTVTV